jgi:hypothetical protein
MATERVVCACGRYYDARRWHELSLFAQLSPAEVAPHATPWPAHLVVEVRVCVGCGRWISRLTEHVGQIRDPQWT